MFETLWNFLLVGLILAGMSLFVALLFWASYTLVASVL